jgi:hypothetical protein
MPSPRNKSHLTSLSKTYLRHDHRKWRKPERGFSRDLKHPGNQRKFFYDLCQQGLSTETGEESLFGRSHEIPDLPQTAA